MKTSTAAKLSVRPLTCVPIWYTGEESSCEANQVEGGDTAGFTAVRPPLRFCSCCWSSKSEE